MKNSNRFLSISIFVLSLWGLSITKGMAADAKALSFDGTNDYIQMNNFVVPVSGDFTVEFWVYNRSNDGYREFISQGSGGSAFYIGITSSTGNIRCGDNWVVTNINLPLNTWTHLALTKSGTQGLLYKNGVQVASHAGYSISSAGTLTLLGQQYGGLEFPDAMLDELRIWNVARSAADISAQMGTELIGTESGLRALYHFNQGVAGGNNSGLTTLLDATANHFDGTLYNFALTGTTSNWVNAGPILGNYNSLAISAGANTTITPSAAPANTNAIVAFTHTNFTGTLVVDPATGVLTVNDAKPAGTYTVTVKAFGNLGYTVTTSFVLTVNDPLCSNSDFTVYTPVSAGTNPRSVAVGDFNVDGNQDIAVANEGSQTVSILLGNGAGGFSGSTDVNVGVNPGSVSVGDFNGDGNQDIAVANGGSNTVSIRLGDGSGVFSGTTNLSVGVSPRSVAIGDFNGDGKQDIAAANGGGNTVSIRLGDGSGGFNGSTNVSVGAAPLAVAIGDFNGDGKQDIATANYGTDAVSIRLGDGTGGFSGSINVSVSYDPFALAIGDFNGDGKQDIATANYGGNSVSIRLGDGSGGFSGSTDISAGIGPIAVAVGDFNGDGKQDIATANAGSHIVSILLGDGTGGFSGSTNLSVGSTPVDVAIGDFNGDGKQDIAAANSQSHTVSILLGGAVETGLKGNGIPIADGDTTPAANDHTDFGEGVFIRTFTIENTGNIPLALASDAFSFTGSDVSMFAVGGITLPDTIIAGASTTFTVTFTPSSDGVKTATLHIVNPDCDEGDYDFAVQGTSLADYNALSFDGTNDYIQMNDYVVPVSGDFTVEFWVYNRSNSGYREFISQGSSGSAFYIGTTSSGGYIRCGDYWQVTNINLPLNTWTHLAITKSGTQGLLYKNGVQVAANGSYYISGAGTTTRLGQQYEYGGLEYPDAMLDELRIWNVARSAAEISAQMGTELTGNEPGLRAIYHFNQGVAGGNNAGLATLLDATTNHFNGTLYNFALTGATSNWVNTGVDTTYYQDSDSDTYGNPAVSQFSTFPPFGYVSNNLDCNDSNTAIQPGATDICNGLDDNCDNAIDNNIEINLKGNGISITDGDITPAANDHTDFGEGVFIRTFTIQNTGITSMTLASNAFSFTGSEASMFAIGGITLPATINAGASRTFTVTFTPGSDGVKMATLHIVNPDCDEGDYDFAIQATGALPTLGTYNSLAIMAGANTTITPGEVPDNTNAIVAFTHTNFTGTLVANPATGVLTVTDAKPAGTYTVTVKAFGNGGYTATTSFVLTVDNPLCSQGDFTGNTEVSAGIGPRSVAVGDFNGDGKQDLAAANSNSYSVSIRLGDGYGGFSVYSVVGVGSSPSAVAIGDFNGDGKQDLAAANEGSNNVSILLGNYTGGFSVYSVVGVGSSPSAVAIGDFNGDGKQDFATANYYSNTVSIRLGDGLGGFSGSTNVSVGSYPISVAIGDFNGDGKQDIAVANYGSNNVYILLGNGTGGFSVYSVVGVDTNPWSVAIGDFNGNGKQDIAAANVGSNNVSILLGNGTGGFSVTNSVYVGSSPLAVAIGDFNGNGIQDIAVANYGSNNVSILLGNGGGGFSGPTSVSVGSGPWSVTVGDFNGDGKQDFAAANYLSNTVSIRLGGAVETGLKGNGIPITDGDTTPAANDHTDFGEGVFIRTFTIENTGTTSMTIASGAFSFTGSEASMFAIGGITLPATISAGASRTFTVTFTPFSNGVKTATLHIVNPDCDEGDYDFAIQATGALPTLGTYNSLAIMAGANTTITPGDVPDNTNAIVAFTHTNFTGTLVVNPATGVLTVTDAKPAGTYTVTVKAFGNGGYTATTSFVLTVNNPLCSPGAFSGSTNVAVGTNPRSVAIGDFNGDGYQDFAAANDISSGTVSIRLGDGLGGFSGSTNVAVGADPHSVAIGDFNGDGKQDFAAANYSLSGTVSIRLGDGLGGFSSGTNVTVGAYPYSVAIGDFNGDGKQDFAAANSSSSGTVSIRLGNGLGGFSSGTNVIVGAYPSSVAIGDFNGDGKQDFAAANNSISGTVSIYLGNGLGGFSGSTNVTVGAYPSSVAIGDFNGDGKQDFAAANNNNSIPGTVSIRLGDGLGGFSGSTNVAVGTSPISVAIGDFNGDGKQDFAATNGSSSTVSIRLGDGLGGFSSSTNVSVGSIPFSVAIGDFNSDGKQDFASTNSNSSTVSIRLGAAVETGLKGNGISITDGDTSPAENDHTDFGEGVFIRTFTIENTGTIPMTLASNAFSFTGSNASMFAVGGITLPDTINAGASRTFTITFTPGSSYGEKTATLHIVNPDCDEGDYDFAVRAFVCEPLTWYLDADNDGRGNPDTSVTACEQPAGYVINATDCDDNNIKRCPNPSEPVTSLITNNSATLDWTVSPCAVGFVVEYRKITVPTTTAWTILTIGSNPCLLSGLEEGENYQWRVKNTCYDTMTIYSGYASPIQVFNTLYRVYSDADGDGYGAVGAAFSFVETMPQAGYALNNTDCDDDNSAIHPGAVELCNGIDDDCDQALETVTNWYQDLDGDGKGNPAVTVISCEPPVGYVANNTDCADNSVALCPKPFDMTVKIITDVSANVSWNDLPCATKYRLEYRRKSPPISAWTVVYTTSPTYDITGLTGPNIQYQWRVATICSPNGTAAESGYAALQSFNTKYKVYTDADMDGFGDANTGPSYVSTMPQPGYTSNQTDCDDAASTTYPGATELCNDIDDDCDLIVDEVVNYWYQDGDGDGLGNPAVSMTACLQPSGYVANGVDCNDNNPTPVCTTPTNVTATGIGASFVTINWTTSPCASGYTVMYRIAPSGAFSTQFNTTGSSMMLSGLLPGTTYQARVRAKCPAPNTVTTSNWVYVTFTTNGASLIEEVDEDISTLDPVTFGVYPNPGDGRFTLSIPGNTDGEADISVLDGFGKIIHSVRWSVYEGITVNELDLTHLPGGVYHINIRKGDMMQTKKVVIVR
jgi:hypothetical protein